MDSNKSELTTQSPQASNAPASGPVASNNATLWASLAFLLAVGAAIVWLTREQWQTPRSLEQIWTSVDRRQWSKAEREVRKYLKSHPDDPEALLLIGRVLAVRGAYVECATLLETVPADSTDRVRALLLAGKAWQEARRRRDAERAWRECLTLSSDDIEAPELKQFCRRMLCGLYAMERRRDDLWNLTEEMLQHCSPAQRHEPLAMRARFEFEMVDPQVALSELEAALAQDPQDLDTLRAVGLYHLEAGNTEKARAHLYRAVQENPKSVLAWESWLLCLHQTADTFGLQQAVRDLPEEANSSAECWRFRALAAERDDDLDQAIAAARRAIELKPFEPENYHRLGQYLVRKGQKEEGQALLTRNVELQNVQQKLREAYDKYRHDYATATSDQRGEIAFQVGHRYDELGHSRAAAAWYRLALSESPSHAQSISALERVENP